MGYSQWFIALKRLLSLLKQKEHLKVLSLYANHFQTDHINLITNLKTINYLTLRHINLDLLYNSNFLNKINQFPHMISLMLYKIENSDSISQQNLYESYKFLTNSAKISLSFSDYDL